MYFLIHKARIQLDTILASNRIKQLLQTET